MSARKLILNGIIEVNCYILDNGDGTDCYIIDPGSQKQRLVEYVREHDLNVVGILLTHAHLDHIGAVDAFKVPVYLHERAKEVLLDDNLNGFATFGVERGIDVAKLDLQTINENTELYLGNERIHIKYTPGHTIGGVCYRLGEDMYTGDTLFKNSVGRWDLPTSDPAMLKKSVIDLIDNTDANIRIHPGHGESSTIGMEKEQNKVYEIWKKGKDIY